ncbi:anthranilate synthase component I family protein [Spirosoma radiotolerans]|uniref:Aminobenzoate synthetase n=1 Tax=Spirosoma radiotolerans TaxID=1379870 RepID=A0A0E3ZXZ9_9BACT|nr:anthranilate synthase component I family protein [Spirosoma radiotolerans]AKD56725.1 aminobenzoate synthetase [Spirosoma radiotolerans]
MNSVRVSVEDLSSWRWQALAWAIAEEAHEDGFVAFLNNNGIDYPNDPFPNRLFVGAKRVISFSENEATRDDVFDVLQQAHREKPAYLVGYLGYDLKNQLENLTSRNPDRLQFPDAYFVEPAWIIDFEESDVLGDALIIQGEGDTGALLKQLRSFVPIVSPVSFPASPVEIQCRVLSEDYLATVRRIQDHIRAGDVYELNYCIEFFAQQAGNIDPLGTYRALTERSPMPFSSFMKMGDRYVMGASPERFLKKTGDRILSQPIKGTVRRGQTPDEDMALRAYLLNSEKERAENLMIVDLVRNDLARSAQTGSIGVDELFGIYGFQQVFQMISTVSATLHERVSWAEAIRHAFPMGSMTGAPKIRSMQLIDDLEVSRRGVYSGAIGFITPEADFDFSVVIRTLLYNAESEYASFSVGSAITYDAEPEQEWEECLLKARAIRDVLASSFSSR